MCAHMGIRHAFLHAFHHPANGRAERAGQQVMEVLRKLHPDRKINWVETMPSVLTIIYAIVEPKIVVFFLPFISFVLISACILGGLLTAYTNMFPSRNQIKKKSFKDERNVVRFSYKPACSP
jgi:hypothetical protein